MSLSIAIVGATGNVGRKIIEVLDKRNFPLDSLYLVASKNSAGKEIQFKNKKLIVEDLEKFDFSKQLFLFFVVVQPSQKNGPKRLQSNLLLSIIQVFIG